MRKRRLALLLAMSMVVNSFSTSTPMFHLHAAETVNDVENTSGQTIAGTNVTVTTGAGIVVNTGENDVTWPTSQENGFLVSESGAFTFVPETTGIYELKDAYDNTWISGWSDENMFIGENYFYLEAGKEYFVYINLNDYSFTDTVWFEQQENVIEFTGDTSVVLPYGDSAWFLKVAEDGLYNVWTDAEYGACENYIDFNGISTGNKKNMNAGEIVLIRSHMTLENQNLFVTKHEKVQSLAVKGMDIIQIPNNMDGTEYVNRLDVLITLENGNVIEQKAGYHSEHDVYDMDWWYFSTDDSGNPVVHFSLTDVSLDVPYEYVSWDNFETKNAKETWEFNSNTYQFFTVSESGYYSVNIKADMNCWGGVYTEAGSALEQVANAYYLEAGVSYLYDFQKDGEGTAFVTIDNMKTVTMPETIITAEDSYQYLQWNVTESGTYHIQSAVYCDIYRNNNGSFEGISSGYEYYVTLEAGNEYYLYLQEVTDSQVVNVSKINGVSGIALDDMESIKIPAGRDVWSYIDNLNVKITLEDGSIVERRIGDYTEGDMYDLWWSYVYEYDENGNSIQLEVVNISCMGKSIEIPYEMVSWDQYESVGIGEEMIFTKTGYQFFTVPESGFYNVNKSEDVWYNINLYVEDGSSIYSVAENLYYFTKDTVYMVDINIYEEGSVSVTIDEPKSINIPESVVTPDDEYSYFLWEVEESGVYRIESDVYLEIYVASEDYTSLNWYNSGNNLNLSLEENKKYFVRPMWYGEDSSIFISKIPDVNIFEILDVESIIVPEGDYPNDYFDNMYAKIILEDGTVYERRVGDWHEEYDLWWEYVYDEDGNQLEVVRFWCLNKYVDIPYQVVAWDEMPTVSAGEEMEFNKNGYQFFTVPESGFYTIKVEDDGEEDYWFEIKDSSVTSMGALYGTYAFEAGKTYKLNCEVYSEGTVKIHINPLDVVSLSETYEYSETYKSVSVGLKIEKSGKYCFDIVNGSYATNIYVYNKNKKRFNVVKRRVDGKQVDLKAGKNYIVISYVYNHAKLTVDEVPDVQLITVDMRTTYVETEAIPKTFALEVTYANGETDKVSGISDLSYGYGNAANIKWYAADDVNREVAIGSRYLEAGKYVYVVTVGDKKLEVPFEVITLDEMASQNPVTDNTTKNWDNIYGKFYCQFTADKNATYEFAFNTPVSLNVKAADGSLVKVTSRDRSIYYLKAQAGEVYNITASASNEYYPTIKMEITSSVGVKDISIEIEKEQVIAGLESLYGRVTSGSYIYDDAIIEYNVNLQYEDGAIGIIGKNDYQDGYGNRVDYSLTKDGEEISLYSSLTVGNYVLRAQLRTDASIYAEKTIEAVKIDPETLPVLLEETDNVYKEDMGMALYQFTPEASGRFVNKYNNELYFFTVDERGLVYHDNYLDGGITYVAYVYYAEDGIVIHPTANRNPVVVVTKPAISGGVLTVDEVKEVNIAEVGDVIEYTFTPEKTGKYTLKRVESLNDTGNDVKVQLLKGKRVLYTTWGWPDFDLTTTLTGGVTYTYKICLNMSDEIGSFQMRLSEVIHKEIVNAEVICKDQNPIVAEGVHDYYKVLEDYYLLRVVFDDGTTSDLYYKYYGEGYGDGEFLGETYDNYIYVSYDSVKEEDGKKYWYFYLNQYDEYEEQLACKLPLVSASEVESTELKLNTPVIEMVSEDSASTVIYCFTAPESGKYIIKNIGDYDTTLWNTVCKYSYKNGVRKYEMKAGETYYFGHTYQNYSDVKGTVTIVKATDVRNVEITKAPKQKYVTDVNDVYLEGMEFTITYANGETRTYSYGESQDYYDYWINEYGYPLNNKVYRVSISCCGYRDYLDLPIYDTDMAFAKISLAVDEEITFNDSEKKPAVVVELNGLVLQKSDYDVTYSNNVNAGIANVTVTGKGKYVGEKTFEFTINPAKLNAGMVEPITSVLHSGEEQKPEVILFYLGAELINGTDYSVVYSDNTDVGMATVEITGLGNYSGTVTANFEIMVNELTCDHNWKKTEIKATCEEDGEIIESCTLCGKEERTALPALGHAMSDFEETIAATCTMTGELTSTCQNEGCTYKETSVIEKTEHNYGEIQETPATSTATGKKSQLCEVCGKELVVEVLYYQENEVVNVIKEEVESIANNNEVDSATVQNAVAKLSDTANDELIAANGMDTVKKLETVVESQNAGKIVEPTYDAEEGIEVTMEGASLTVASKMQEDEEQTGATYNAELQISVSGNDHLDKEEFQDGEVLVLDLTLNVITKDENGEIKNTEKVSDPVAPIEITMSVPTDYVGTVFKLYHVTDEGVVELPYTLSADGLSITFTTPSFSDFAYYKVGCGRKHELENLTEGQVVPASCGAAGSIEWKCGSCDFTTTQTIPALKHTFTVKLVEECKEATCQNEGCIVYQCANAGCDERKTETIAKTEHVLEVIETKEATCTEMGYTISTCQNEGCDETLTSYTAQKGHDMKWMIEREATCTEAELKYTKCQNCEYQTDAIEGNPKLGHEWVNAENLYKTATCTTKEEVYEICEREGCDESRPLPAGDALGHEYEYIVTKEPTCNETGSQYGDCIRCDVVTEDEVIPATGKHEYQEVVHEATCGTAGVKYDECKVCGTKVNETEIPATGKHSYKTVVTKNATCTTAGSQHDECSVCGDKVNVKAIAATGHKEVIDKAVGATCTTDGLTEGKHCATCNTVLVKQEVVKASGHNYETVVETNATCGAAGSKYNKCKVCGVKTVSEEVAATGNHKFVVVVDKAATCGATGSQHEECSVCKVQKAAVEISATGNHTYGEFVVTKEATVLAEGEQTKTCSICKDQISESIAKRKATIKVNAKSIKLKKGQTTTAVKVTMDETDAIKSWKSSNAKVASVSKTGKITAKKVGKATITVTLKSGKTAKVSVNVQKTTVKTTKLTLNKKNLVLKKGESFKLEAMATPITTQQKVTFKSSNKKIATVTSKGLIKAKKKGKVTITVKSGSKTVKCKVKVK